MLTSRRARDVTNLKTARKLTSLMNLLETTTWIPSLIECPKKGGAPQHLNHVVVIDVALRPQRRWHSYVDQRQWLAASRAPKALKAIEPVVFCPEIHALGGGIVLMPAPDALSYSDLLPQPGTGITAPCDLAANPWWPRP